MAIISQDFSEDSIEDRLYLFKIAAKLDDRVEPVPYHPSKFNSNDPLVYEIKKNGIQIV